MCFAMISCQLTFGDHLDSFERSYKSKYYKIVVLKEIRVAFNSIYMLYHLLSLRRLKFQFVQKIKKCNLVCSVYKN